MEKGLIHVYYGYGKGKTTAALGLALRAAGYGKQAVIVQFLKNRLSGEALPQAKNDNITVLRGQADDNFVKSMSKNEAARTAEIHNENLAKAIALVAEDKCDLLILDEVMDAYQMNMVDKDMLENFIKNKPENLELVITGHFPEHWMLNLADYVSEVVKKKHPYDCGIPARKGIEY